MLQGSCDYYIGKLAILRSNTTVLNCNQPKFIIVKFRKNWYKKFMQKGGLILLLFLVSSCASPVISKEMRGRAADLPFEAIDKNPNLYKGTVLIWGGRILSAKQTEDACMAEVLKMPLDSYLVAQENEESRRVFCFYPGPS
jgi:starvation-inducible outer membrane lipoprotein